MSKRTENVDLLITDLAEWARTARLRGFSSDEICAALGAGALSTLERAGVSADQVHDIVKHHYGTENTARPSVKA